MGSKRERITSDGNRRLAPNDAQGCIRESGDPDRTLRRDMRKPPKHALPSGQGERDARKRH